LGEVSLVWLILNKINYMNTKNVNFGEEKLRIKIVNKQSITGQGGTVSIMYEDISSLSVVKNPQKPGMTITSLLFIGVGVYMYSQSVIGSSPLFCIVSGLIFLIWSLMMPKEHLGVETRGGSQYLTNVPGAEIFEIIDEIEKRRKSFKK